MIILLISAILGSIIGLVALLSYGPLAAVAGMVLGGAGAIVIAALGLAWRTRSRPEPAKPRARSAGRTLQGRERAS